MREAAMEGAGGGQQLDSWVQPWKNHVALLLDRTTPKARATAGVGLVLDTRQAAALAAGRAIEKELAELRGHATPGDHDCSGELQVVGATQSPELRDLNERLGKALVEQQAAKEENSVVVSRQHVQGAAFRSGRICNGDIVAKVDGIPIGADLARCGQLIRGDVDTTVTLHLRKPGCMEEEAVTLQRAIIPDHHMPTSPVFFHYPATYTP